MEVGFGVRRLRHKLICMVVRELAEPQLIGKKYKIHSSERFQHRRSPLGPAQIKIKIELSSGSGDTSTNFTSVLSGLSAIFSQDTAWHLLMQARGIC